MKKSRLKTVGKKGQRRQKYYREAKAAYLAEHPHCEMCGKPNDHVHHKAGRSSALLWHKELFANLCDLPCHRKVHDNIEWSVENGWIVRLTREEEQAINEFYRAQGMV